MFLRHFFDAVFLVAIFLAIPLLCLLIAWFDLSKAKSYQTKRERLPPIAFRLALISFIFAFAYLVRLYVLNTPSVLNPPEKYWVPVNWFSGLSWLSVIVLVIFGKGRSRVGLGLWCVIFPIFVGFAHVAVYAY